MNLHESAVRSPTGVLAEDEPLLAEELGELLHTLWPQLHIAAYARDGVEALHVIEETTPDVVFLDIHMPLLNGLEVARRIERPTQVVFITSYDEHALAAFEAGAIDYVLKPPSPDRLLTTLRRVQSRLRSPHVDRRGDLPATPPPTQPKRFLQWINASRGTAVRLITVEEILYFKADQKFTLVVTADSESLIRKTIRELKDELDPEMFWQVHRSTIVNLHAIDSVVRDDRGTLGLRLKNRRESLAVSEAHAHRFRQM
jgi:DNA-binding LytR/AlgR family response regulator